jgi:hypothetical protein
VVFTVGGFDEKARMVAAAGAHEQGSERRRCSVATHDTAGRNAPHAAIGACGAWAGRGTMPVMARPDAALPGPTPIPNARRRAAGWLALVAEVLAVGLAWHGPVRQPAGYHAFADARTWFGLPNGANVASNLPFALVGLWLLAGLRRAGGAATGAWRLFGLALLCTAAGSALYHLAPANGTLVFDRIPIAWACAALVAALLAERVDARWATPPLLAAGLAFATLSVLHWWWTERLGAGDLRLYLFVHALPMLLVPALLLQRHAPPLPGATPDAAWWAVLGCYAAAKAAELLDHRLLDLLGFASGHALKHLLAAVGAALLVRGVLGAATSGSPR